MKVPSPMPCNRDYYKYFSRRVLGESPPEVVGGDPRTPHLYYCISNEVLFLELFKIAPTYSLTTPKRRINRMRFVVDGFVYHNNVIAGTPPLRYLGCAEHKRSGCRGRATIPVGGTLDMLKMTQPHNHPPDVNAEEKDAFLKELKSAIRSNSMEKVTLKKVYETIGAAFPKAAEEIPFRSISSSLHRWRRDPLL